MGRFAIWQYGRKARRERILRKLVSHINSGDEQAAFECLAPDLVVVDVGGKRTAGRAAFLLRDRAFREEYGNPQVVIDTLDHHADEVLVRMHHSGDAADLAGPTFWRVAFEEDAISLIESTHEARYNPSLRAYTNSQTIAE